ncbi:MAG: GHKL domain-containing protein [Oscillospiraceae bacterium]|nr:GHKL domain-containing protein [Oscillospiraceae bacterium]
MGKKWIKRYDLIMMGVVCALAVFVCLLLYQYDNKYTAVGPRGANGVLVLDEQAIIKTPVVFLVDGWEYYGGRLMLPEDFAGNAPVPDAYIFIGQYGGFDANDVSKPPHGSASYGLTVRIPTEPKTYLLELPEIFSAYRTYVNGKLVETMGNPDPTDYFPETGNRTIEIEAGGQIEILIAVSDFSNLYSGLTYPPAFGEPDAVNRLLSARLIFRSVFLAFALVIGLIALLIGFASGKKILAVLFGLLCLFFIGYTCYPILRTLISAYYPFYAIENISFCAMLTTVILLQKNLYGEAKKRDWFFIGFGVLMFLISAVLPLMLTSGKLWVMVGYSYLIMAYEWITAAYLTITAVRTLLREVRSTTLLYGILIFDAALVMDRLMPLYEPIVTGWFPELASFALVLCLGIVIANEVAAKYRDNAVLEERMSSMEHLTEMQRTNYELLRERIEETKTVQHDLRHHFVMIEGFLQSREYKNLEEYIRQFHESIQSVQPLGYSKNPMVNVLVRHYAGLAEKEKIRLTLKLDIGQDVKVSEADLCAILSNLLENGIEACARQKSGERFITLSMGQKPSMLSIRMENSTDGNVTRRGTLFLSSKGEDRKGYGLGSVHSIAQRYSGDTEFQHDNDSNVFISTIMLTF